MTEEMKKKERKIRLKDKHVSTDDLPNNDMQGAMEKETTYTTLSDNTEILV